MEKLDPLDEGEMSENNQVTEEAKIDQEGQESKNNDINA